jgi:hypothetical protein
MSGVKKVTYPNDERGPVNCHAYTLEIDRSTIGQLVRTAFGRS